MKRPGGFDGTPVPRPEEPVDFFAFAARHPDAQASPRDAATPEVSDTPDQTEVKDASVEPGFPVAPVRPLQSPTRVESPGTENPVATVHPATEPDEHAPATAPESTTGRPPARGGPLGPIAQFTVPDPVQRAAKELRLAERARKLRERRDQRRFTAHARRRRRNALIVAGAVGGLALFVILGAFTPLMGVREVSITGTNRLDPAELQTALSRFEGVPLALVDETEVHRALEPFPLIQGYSIERVPPHTLVVRVEERDPVIALEHEGVLGLVDAAGVQLVEVSERPAGVPLGAGTVVDTASPAFHDAARVVRDLPADLRERLATVTATTGRDIEFSLVSGTRVVWGDPSDTQRKAVVLRAMLASVGDVTMIDVSSPDTPVFL